MATDGYSRLKEEQKKALLEATARQEQLNKFKDDYKTLKDKLLVLPDKVKHNVMVPIGKLGFMPGQLIHTNEITVLLGDNWFAERSAKQAAGIVDRRLAELDRQIETLESQKSLLNPRLQFTDQFQAEASEGIEIREEYNEEEEKIWREKHKERVREHNQREREEARQIEQGKRPGMSSRDATAALERLARLERDPERGPGDSSGDSSGSMNQQDRLSEEDELRFLSEEDDDDDDSSEGEQEMILEAQDGTVIKIKHTQISRDTCSLELDTSDSSAGEDAAEKEPPLFKTPGDITTQPRGDSTSLQVRQRSDRDREKPAALSHDLDTHPEADILVPRSILKKDSSHGGKPGAGGVEGGTQAGKRVAFEKRSIDVDGSRSEGVKERNVTVKQMVSSAFLGTVQECFPGPPNPTGGVPPAEAPANLPLAQAPANSPAAPNTPVSLAQAPANTPAALAQTKVQNPQPSASSRPVSKFKKSRSQTS